MTETTTPTYRSFTVGDSRGGGTFCGRFDHDVEKFSRTITERGHVVTYDGQSTPWNHHVIGVGVGHDDAAFAETGRSMAAYYENGEASQGRWWDIPHVRRHYTGEAGR